MGSKSSKEKIQFLIDSIRTEPLFSAIIWNFLPIGRPSFTALESNIKFPVTGNVSDIGMNYREAHKSATFETPSSDHVRKENDLIE